METIEFIRSKDYKFIKEIGQGGTGKTVLLRDDIIDEMFVCKKYSPYYPEQKEMYFNNFIQEIKILYKIYHPNIVRVFSYFLYPEHKTGYIVMEYIEGADIYSFAKENPEKINDLFLQTIEGFWYLEKNKILHRDIRPDNILVTNDSIVKVIDFGFGKKIELSKDYDKSVSLNWRYAQPSDFQDNTYDFQTEVYFVGKLFEEIILQNDLRDFKFSEILKEMIKKERVERLESFFDIHRKIIDESPEKTEFSEEEIGVYRNFADQLLPVISKIDKEAKYKTDIDSIVNELDKIYVNSMLEEFVQHSVKITRAFINGTYYYNRESFLISVETLKKFVNLIKSTTKSKKSIIFNNIWQRIDAIERYNEEKGDDLPF